MPIFRAGNRQRELGRWQLQRRRSHQIRGTSAQRGPLSHAGQNSRRRSTEKVFLSHDQLRKRSIVDTSPLNNPFSNREPGPILLCTDCKSGEKSGDVICNPRKYRSKSASALSKWKNRVLPVSTHSVCWICQRLKFKGQRNKLPSEDQLKKSAVLNLQPFTVVLDSREAQEAFCVDLCRRSGLDIEGARFLLHNVSESRFRSLNHNHTRHASAFAASPEPALKGFRTGFCVFRERGCTGTNTSLRHLRFPSWETLRDTEIYYEYEEAVHNHSGGVLAIWEISGKQACSVCRYVVTTEKFEWQRQALATQCI